MIKKQVLKKNLNTQPKALALAVRRAALVSLVSGTVSLSSTTLAGPQGGQVVGGAGSISVDGLTTNIQQTSSSLAIDWQSFNLSADELVRFDQRATDIVLNRVIGRGGASQIFGAIDAKGHVFLVNPQGILFGKTARINVGSLTASGLQIDPEDFMRGQYEFSADELVGAGAVINQGLIRAAVGDKDAGSILLLGNLVVNEGSLSIEAGDPGSIGLVSGRSMVVTFDPDGLIGVEVSEAVVEKAREDYDSAVLNSGEIIADGGHILLSGQVTEDLFSQAVNNQGLLQAKGIHSRNGKISLLGSDDIQNTGIVDVSADLSSDLPSEQMNGGSIHIESNADTLIVGESQLLANSATGQGGQIKVLGERVGLGGGTEVQANGALGGGEILIGGDYQGKNPQVKNAKQTVVEAGVRISANATEKGQGGKVIVWSDEGTRFAGKIQALGGVSGGNGGFVEVSGGNLIADNWHQNIDVTAAAGESGTILLDPDEITIRGGTGDGGDEDTDLPSGTDTADYLGDEVDLDNGRVDDCPDTSTGCISFDDRAGGGGNLRDEFIVYESEIENTDANIILHAYREVNAEGEFDNDDIALLAGNSLEIEVQNNRVLGGDNFNGGIDLVSGLSGSTADNGLTLKVTDGTNADGSNKAASVSLKTGTDTDDSPSVKNTPILVGDIESGSGGVLISANGGSIETGNISSAGDISLTAVTGENTPGSIDTQNLSTSNGSINLTANASINAGTLSATGGDVDVSAGDALTVGTVSAEKLDPADAAELSRNINMISGALLSTGNLSAQGNISLASQSAIDAGALSVIGGNILMAADEAISVGNLSARKFDALDDTELTGDITLDAKANLSTGELLADGVILLGADGDITTQQIDAQRLTVSRATNFTVDGIVTTAGNVRLSGLSGTANFNGLLSANNLITASNSQNVLINAGASFAEAVVFNNNGTVRLAAGTQAGVNDSLSFANGVDSRAAGLTELSGTLLVDNGDTGDASNNGSAQFGTSELQGDTEVRAANTSFTGTLDSETGDSEGNSYGLTLSGNGSFAEDIGAAQALDSLEVAGTSAFTKADAEQLVRTLGDQTYQNEVTRSGGDLSINAASLLLGDALNAGGGSVALSLDSLSLGNASGELDLTQFANVDQLSFATRNGSSILLNQGLNNNLDANRLSFLNQVIFQEDLSLIDTDLQLDFDGLSGIDLTDASQRFTLQIQVQDLIVAGDLSAQGLTLTNVQRAQFNGELDLTGGFVANRTDGLTSSSLLFSDKLSAAGVEVANTETVEFAEIESTGALMLRDLTDVDFNGHVTAVGIDIDASGAVSLAQGAQLWSTANNSQGEFISLKAASLNAAGWLLAESSANAADGDIGLTLDNLSIVGGNADGNLNLAQVRANRLSLGLSNPDSAIAIAGEYDADIKTLVFNNDLQLTDSTRISLNPADARIVTQGVDGEGFSLSLEAAAEIDVLGNLTNLSSLTLNADLLKLGGQVSTGLLNVTAADLQWADPVLINAGILSFTSSADASMVLGGDGDAWLSSADAAKINGGTISFTAAQDQKIQLAGDLAANRIAGYADYDGITFNSAVELSADSTLVAAQTSFSEALDSSEGSSSDNSAAGANALTLNVNAATFNEDIGAERALGGLTVTGSSNFNKAGEQQVNSGGDQRYQGRVTRSGGDLIIETAGLSMAAGLEGNNNSLEVTADTLRIADDALNLNSFTEVAGVQLQLRDANASIELTQDLSSADINQLLSLNNLAYSGISEISNSNLNLSLVGLTGNGALSINAAQALLGDVTTGGGLLQVSASFDSASNAGAPAIQLGNVQAAGLGLTAEQGLVRIDGAAASSAQITGGDADAPWIDIQADSLDVNGSLAAQSVAGARDGNIALSLNALDFINGVNSDGNALALADVSAAQLRLENTGGDIQTSGNTDLGGNFTSLVVASNLSLSNDTSLAYSNANNISNRRLQLAAVDSGSALRRSFSLDAAGAQLSAADLGATQALGDVTLSNAADLSLQAVSANRFTLTDAQNLVLSGAATIRDGAFSITNVEDISLQAVTTENASNGHIELSANNRIELNGNLDAAGNLSLTALDLLFDPSQVSLNAGGVLSVAARQGLNLIDAVDGRAGMNLSAEQLAAMQAEQLGFSAEDGINLGGALTTEASAGLVFNSALNLVSNTAVNASGFSAQSITEETSATLEIDAERSGRRGEVSLGATEVSSLAIEGANHVNINGTVLAAGIGIEATGTLTVADNASLSSRGALAGDADGDWIDIAAADLLLAGTLIANDGANGGVNGAGNNGNISVALDSLTINDSGASFDLGQVTADRLTLGLNDADAFIDISGSFDSQINQLVFANDLSLAGDTQVNANQLSVQGIVGNDRSFSYLGTGNFTASGDLSGLNEFILSQADVASFSGSVSANRVSINANDFDFASAAGQTLTGSNGVSISARQALSLVDATQANMHLSAAELAAIRGADLQLSAAGLMTLAGDLTTATDQLSLASNLVLVGDSRLLVNGLQAEEIFSSASLPEPADLTLSLANGAATVTALDVGLFTLNETADFTLTGDLNADQVQINNNSSATSQARFLGDSTVRGDFVSNASLTQLGDGADDQVQAERIEINGASQLAGQMTANDRLTFGVDAADTVTLVADTELNASNGILVNGAVAASGTRQHSLTTNNDAVFTSSINNLNAFNAVGDLEVEGTLSEINSLLASQSATFNSIVSNIDRLEVTNNALFAGLVQNVSSLQVGGAATFNGRLQDLNLVRLNGDASFAGQVQNISDTLQIGGNASFADDLENIAVLNVAGTSQIGASQIQAASQTYQGQVSLANNVEFDGNASFLSQVQTDGTPRNMAVTGDASFAGDLGSAGQRLGSLSVGGTTTLGANAYTSATTQLADLLLNADATLDSLGALQIGGNISGTINGNHGLQISAASIDVTGSSTLNQLIANSAASQQWQGALNANALSLNGADLSLGQVAVAGDINLVASNSVTHNGQLSTSNGGRYAVQHGGLLSINQAMNLDGSFSETGSGTVNLGADISTQGNDINFANAISLTNDVQLSTQENLAGDIVLSTVNGQNLFDLTLIAGLGQINAGSLSNLGRLSVSNQGLMSLVDISAEDILLDSGELVLNGALTATQGAIEITSQGDISIANGLSANGVNGSVSVNSASGAINQSGDIQTTGSAELSAAQGQLTSALINAGNIRLNGQSVVSNGPLTADSGAVEINSSTSTQINSTINGNSVAINAGTEFSQAAGTQINASGNLDINAGADASLGQLNAATINVSANQLLVNEALTSNSGDINLNSLADMTINGQVQAAQNLSLNSGAALTANADLIALNGNAELTAVNDINLNALLQAAGNVQVTAQQGAIVQALGQQIQTQQGDVELTAEDDVLISRIDNALSASLSSEGGNVEGHIDNPTDHIDAVTVNLNAQDTVRNLSIESGAVLVNIDAFQRINVTVPEGASENDTSLRQSISEITQVVSNSARARVENVTDIDPAIFTEVSNFTVDANPIRLPEDQVEQ